MLQNQPPEEYLPLEQMCPMPAASSHQIPIDSCEQIQQQASEESPESYHVYELSFYGWRKKCLYFFLAVVSIVVLINALLTLWIIAVLSFSMDGIGKLKILDDGLRLDGDAFLFNDVNAKQICSRDEDQKIRIQSKNNIKLNVQKSDRRTSNQLFIDKNVVSCLSNQFVVRNSAGSLVFLVSDSSAVVATDKLRVNNAAGIKFNGSIQVPLVQSTIGSADAISQLNVLSPTRKIKFRGPLKVSFKSQADFSAACSGNLNVRSKRNSILFDAPQIELSNLRTAYLTKRGTTYPGIHQLCMCADSGKLFIASAEGSCVVDDNVCGRVEREVSIEGRSLDRRAFN